MKLEEFSKIFKESIQKINLKIDEIKINKFYKYMKLLIEWNEKINLTAINDPKEIIIKHFIDSLTVSKEIENSSTIIDVGTGAGFPGIPLKIFDSSLNITLLDSLNKRTIFLKEVIKELDLNNIEVIHGRAEDYAHKKNYRECYDYAISRAVAPLNILCEYLIPYVRVNGKMIAMKGSNATEEILSSETALTKLNANISKSNKVILPNESGERYILIIEKTKKVSSVYPRKAGIPKKNPL